MKKTALVRGYEALGWKGGTVKAVYEALLALNHPLADELKDSAEGEYANDW